MRNEVILAGDQRAVCTEVQQLAESGGGRSPTRAQEILMFAEVRRRSSLFIYRAGSAFFGPEYLLFGKIELAYNEFVSL